MKHLRLGIIVVLLFVAIAAFAQDDLIVPEGEPGETYLAAFPYTVTLDGDFSDWEGVPTVLVDEGGLVPVSDFAQMSFTFGAVADMENLYIMVLVNDQSIVAGQHEGNYWNEDTVELYINATEDFEMTSYAPGVAQMWFPAVNIDKPAEEVVLAGIQGETSEATSVTVQTDYGWAVEIAIPLHTGVWDIEPSHGAFIGFNAEISGASEISVDRNVKLGWAIGDRMVGNSWQDPSAFGTLIFYEIGQESLPDELTPTGEKQEAPDLCAGLPNTSAFETVSALDFINDAEVVPNAGDIEGVVGGLDPGEWLQFCHLDFGQVGADEIIFDMAVNPNFAGRTVEVILDDVRGPVIATLTTEPTTEEDLWHEYGELVAEVTEPVSGVHDVILRFDGGPGVGNLRGFSFTESTDLGACADAPTVDAQSFINATSYAAGGEVSNDADGYEGVIGGLDPGDWVQYCNIDFGDGGLGYVELNMAVNPNFAGRTVTVMLDTLNGTEVTTITTEPTTEEDAWHEYGMLRGAFYNEITGVHNVLLLFDGTGGGIGNLQGFNFAPDPCNDAESVDALSTISAASMGDYANVTPNADDVEGRVGGLDNGDWMRYCNIDFGDGGVGTVEFEIAVNPNFAGQPLTVVLDSPDGPVIAELMTEATSEEDVWDAFAMQSAKLMTDVSGVHDVFLMVGGTFGLGNLQSFSFEPDVCLDAPTVDAFSTISAASMNEYANVTPNADDVEGRVGGLDNGDWIRYCNVDFGDGASSVDFEIAVNPNFAGQTIYVVIDGLSGPVVAELTTEASTEEDLWDVFVVQSAEFTEEVSGVHDVYLIMEGTFGIGNLNWLQFK